jgi:hypothetical protein
MYRATTTLLALTLATLQVASQAASTEVLASHLAVMGGLATDAARDSLNALVKAEMRDLLDRDEAFGTSFEGVPMSRVDAPDGTFRMFTWNVPREDGSHLYEGYLLMRIGSRQSLVELRDMSAGIPSPEVPELGPDRWYGALYYDVVLVKKGAKTYYTLLGWKGHSSVETRKVIEVLHFKGKQPRFGAPLFGTGRLKANRKVFGYSFQTSMGLWYEKDQGRIVLDHLSPARADMEGQRAFYGPDLSYDAYVWDKGVWRYERDIDARDIRRSGKPFNAPPPPPKP